MCSVFVHHVWCSGGYRVPGAGGHALYPLFSARPQTGGTAWQSIAIVLIAIIRM